MKRGYWVNVARENGIKADTYYMRKKRGMSDEEAATTPLIIKGGSKKPKKEYAVYKGDELIVVGTADECAEFLGVRRETIYFYASPSAENRNTRAIVLEDDEFDE